MKESWLNTNIKPVLGVLIAVSVIGYFFMCSIRNIKPDPQITIAMVSALSIVLGYFFGSSVGSSKKDDLLGKPATSVSGDNPTVNVSPAPEQPVNTTV